jgi:hypothetical protein
MIRSSTVSRNFPTLRYLTAPFRWFFRSRRRVLTASAVLLATIATPVVWWFIQLMGLPDIGDPFDVEAYRSITIPDDRNAFVLYREATARLVRRGPSGPPQDRGIDLQSSWSKADPRLRHWVEENREAMEIYRRGAERPDAIASPDDRMIPDFRALFWLAMLEASRLEEQGDMAGAWVWYRTALRSTYHLGCRGLLIHRLVADRLRGLALLPRVGTWSANSRTTRALVRHALDEAVACQSLAASDVYSINVEYPLLVRLHDSPKNPGRDEMISRVNAMISNGDYGVELRRMQWLLDAWRFWRREPERSRRVIRLAIANWLAYYELPPERRPKPDHNVPGPFEFYTFGPEVPANARALSPQALDRWMESSIDARPILEIFDPRVIHRKEQRGYRALVVLLAIELHRRDYGTIPLRDEELVGPYLKELPDDGLGGAGDATAADGSIQKGMRE